MKIKIIKISVLALLSLSVHSGGFSVVVITDIEEVYKANQFSNNLYELVTITSTMNTHKGKETKTFDTNTRDDNNVSLNILSASELTYRTKKEKLNLNLTSENIFLGKQVQTIKVEAEEFQRVHNAIVKYIGDRKYAHLRGKKSDYHIKFTYSDLKCAIQSSDKTLICKYHTRFVAKEKQD